MSANTETVASSDAAVTNIPLDKTIQARFVRNLDSDDRRHMFEYWSTEFLKVSGMYWGVCSLILMKTPPDDKEKVEMVDFLRSCYHTDSGGFGGNVGHDAHILYTLSAIQVLILLDSLDQVVDVDKTAAFLASQQQPDGSFQGDQWGEIDSRFSYVVIMALSLLGKLHLIDLETAVHFLLRCKNFDEAFGACPEGESHAGQTFCCVAALAIAGALDRLDADKLAWWLCERQLPCGGLNGRPEKKEDVCYSWWVLSALGVLRRLHWIDLGALEAFILGCQDTRAGGISDRPENMADVFHLFFGVAGLSLVGGETAEGLLPIDPAYAMPEHILEKLGISKKF